MLFLECGYGGKIFRIKMKERKYIREAGGSLRIDVLLLSKSWGRVGESWKPYTTSKLGSGGPVGCKGGYIGV